MNHSSAFKRIELHLAKSKEFPAGSARHGYRLVAPLDEHGYADVALWKTHREQCRVHRFWQGEPDEAGYLVHKSGVASAPAGSSITTRLESTMMNPVTV